MYTSKYFTCEQIDQRLLQGYLDDYNQQNNLSLTKEEFLELIYNKVQNEKYLSVKNNQNLTTAEKVKALGNLGIPSDGLDILNSSLTQKLRIKKEENGEWKDAGFIGMEADTNDLEDQDTRTFLIQTSKEASDSSDDPTDIMVRAKDGEVMIESESVGSTGGKSYISVDATGNSASGNRGGIWLKEGYKSPDATRGNQAESSIHLLDNTVNINADNNVNINTDNTVNINADNYVNINADNNVNIRKYQGDSRITGYVGCTNSNIYLLRGLVGDDDNPVTIKIGIVNTDNTDPNYLKVGTVSNGIIIRKENFYIVNPVKVKVESPFIELRKGPYQNITIEDHLHFYDKNGKFLFKYKDVNQQDVVLDLLAKIQELENRIAALEGNS